VKLQRIDEAQGFVDIAAEREVVDVCRLHDAGLVDEEGAAQGDAAGQQHAKGACDVLGDVGDHGELDLAEPALIDGRIFPCEVGEVRVDGDGHDLDVLLLELREAVVVREDFGRAHEGEVERVEEDQAVVSGEVGLEVELLDDLVVGHDGRGGEVGHGLGDEGGRAVGGGCVAHR